jgi:hypothetical protein
MKISFATEVQTDSTGKWYGNAARFATEREAEAWVHDRMMRWTAVRGTRVVESDDPVNCHWDFDTNKTVVLTREEKMALREAAPAIAALLREQGIIK